MLNSIMDKLEEYKDYLIATNDIITDIADKIRNFDFGKLKGFMPK